MVTLQHTIKVAAPRAEVCDALATVAGMQRWYLGAVEGPIAPGSVLRLTPTGPFGFDELSVAGGLRGRPVELARCVSVDERCIARAEVVIAGEILPERRVAEGSASYGGADT